MPRRRLAVAEHLLSGRKRVRVVVDVNADFDVAKRVVSYLGAFVNSATVKQTERARGDFD
jgi:spore coat polysaccharide biosynthesis protein SpsF (cytidylyltransferase family)